MKKEAFYNVHNPQKSATESLPSYSTIQPYHQNRSPILPNRVPKFYERKGGTEHSKPATEDSNSEPGFSLLQTSISSQFQRKR